MSNKDDETKKAVQLGIFWGVIDLIALLILILYFIGK